MLVQVTAKLLLIFSIVAYFMHSYFRNTMDFTYYRHIISIPVSNPLLKYVYVNSFFLFVLSTAVFVTSIVADVLQLRSAVQWWLLAGSVILALGALRLITLPAISHWPCRAR